jgi:hypothetical protein
MAFSLVFSFGVSSLSTTGAPEVSGVVMEAILS